MYRLFLFQAKPKLSPAAMLWAGDGKGIGVIDFIYDEEDFSSFFGEEGTGDGGTWGWEVGKD